MLIAERCPKLVKRAVPRESEYCHCLSNPPKKYYYKLMITTKPRIWQKFCTSHLPNVKFIFIPALEMVVHDESESCGVAHFQVGPPPPPPYWPSKICAKISRYKNEASSNLSKHHFHF